MDRCCVLSLARPSACRRRLCVRGDIERALVAAKANVNAGDQAHGTALREAAAGGHLDVVQSLIAAGADLNLSDDIDGYTPLMSASANGNAAIVRALLAARADIGVKDNGGDTTFIMGMKKGHQEVKVLLGQASGKEPET